MDCKKVICCNNHALPRRFEGNDDRDKGDGGDYGGNVS
jgi:hypothetical protein